MPHDIAADPRLKQTDIRVLTALLYHARDTLVCRPCDASIGQRVCRSPATVQRSLRRLEAIGYIAREAVQPSDENRTGRLIHLLWRDPDWPRPALDPPSTSARPPKHQYATPQAPVRDRREGEKEKRNVTNVPLPERTTSQPRMPQELTTATPTTSRPPQPARPLSEELKALPGASQNQVRSLAWRLAHHLQDIASIGFFISVLGLVTTGLAPVERLLAAFVVADRARGKARKPGAIFAVSWASWQPPPKPSEINRPTYHRAPATIPRHEPPPPEPGPKPMEPITADMLRDWETWAEQPHHPLAGYARKMLAAHQVGEPPQEGGGYAVKAEPVAAQVEAVVVPMVDQAKRDKAKAMLAHWEGLTAEERKRIDAAALALADADTKADYEGERVPVVRRMKLATIRNAYLDATIVAR